MMSPVNEAILLDQPVLSRIGIEDREISQTTSRPHKRPTGLGIRSARALPAHWAQSAGTSQVDTASYGSVVQPVGGHGGIEFSIDGRTLTKPTNKVELAFYLEVFEERANPNNVYLVDLPRPVALPPVYVIRQKYAALEPHIPALIKHGDNNGIPYITIANIGAGLGQDLTRIMDVKIGTATVLDTFENFVFIASSLLFCYASGSREVRVKMIDFGHSYIKGNDELLRIGQMNVAKYKSQFTGGLAFLGRDLKHAADLAKISKMLRTISKKCFPNHS